MPVITALPHRYLSCQKNGLEQKNYSMKWKKQLPMLKVVLLTTLEQKIVKMPQDSIQKQKFWIVVWVVPSFMMWTPI